MLLFITELMHALPAENPSAEKNIWTIGINRVNPPEKIISPLSDKCRG
jgi:hypothetical protein